MRAARYAWGLCLASCLCIAVYLVLFVGSDRRPWSAKSLEGGFPLVPVGVVLGAVIGALILARHPRNPVGWVLAVGALGAGLGIAADMYAIRVLTEHELGPPAAGRFGAWVSLLFGAAFALPLLCALFLLVPDGRLPSWRWRPVMVALVAAFLLWAGVLVVAVRPRQAAVTDPDVGPLAGLLLDISTLLVIVVTLVSAAALVVRLRRSTGMRRRQLRWIMTSAFLLAAGLLALVGYQIAEGPFQPWYAIAPLYFGYASVPVCTGIAVLRYRLYDIDVIISRAVVLGVLTGAVTVGYVAVVVAVGAALGTGVHDRFWLSLAALVLVALAVQPLRQRVERFADRLVYGPRAAPYEALADFNRRLGGNPGPAELLPQLAEAVARSVGAAHARVEVDIPGTAARSAAWPAGSTPPDPVPDLELDVSDRDEPLGRLAVRMPPGHRLRPGERRLIEDFAAQAGLAFRNIRLDAQLRARVAELGRQAVELAASRRRLLAARDDERRRVAAVIDREVLVHLRPIPDALAALAPDGAAADATLDRLETGAAAGLDALREVTRGLFPATLARRGLVPALRAHLSGGGGELTVAPGLDGRRFDDRIESAAYFCAVAMLRLLPGPVRLALDGEDGLVLEATAAREPTDHGDELTSIADRAEAAGGTVSRGTVSRGTVSQDRDPDGEFRLRVRFDQDRPANAQTAASRSVPNADFAT